MKLIVRTEVALALQDCRIARACDGRVEIVEGSPSVRTFPPRVSSGLGLCLKRDPRAHDVRADGRALSYPGWSLCVRPPGCTWSSAAVGAPFVSIDIEPEILPGDAAFAPMSFLAPDEIALESLASRLLAARDVLARDEALVEIVARLAAHDLLHADEALGSTGGPAAAARARERLAADPGTELGLDELARDAGCNKYLLVRAFKRRWGITPHAMRLCLRIEAARARLARGEPPAEVAAAVGFADQSHLGRHFKRIVGIAPMAYARQARAFVVNPAAVE
jgi:AraC-like DNA-binding protein